MARPPLVLLCHLHIKLSFSGCAPGPEAPLRALHKAQGRAGIILLYSEVLDSLYHNPSLSHFGKRSLWMWAHKCCVIDLSGSDPTRSESLQAEQTRARGSAINPFLDLPSLSLNHLQWETPVQSERCPLGAGRPGHALHCPEPSNHPPGNGTQAWIVKFNHFRSK